MEATTQDFLNQMAQATEKDSEPKPEIINPFAPPPIVQTNGRSSQRADQPRPKAQNTEDEDADEDFDDDDDDDLSDPGMIADICVEGVDMLHNMSMQMLSGIADERQFKVPKAGIARIKKVLKKLIAKWNTKMHPGWMLLCLFAVVYGPTTMSAINIRIQRKRAQNKLKNKSDVTTNNANTKVVEPDEDEDEDEPEIILPGKSGRPPGTTIKNGASGWQNRKKKRKR